MKSLLTYIKAMKKIPLWKRGNVVAYAVVDDDDYERLNKSKWFHRDRYATNKNKSLHREVVGAKKGEYVDHINGDRYDNRRRNLRVCTPAQNSWNRKVGRSHSASKYKGVTWRKNSVPGKNWCVSIRQYDKLFHFGYYTSEEEAAYIYDQVALQLFGDYAGLNLLGG